MLQIAKVNNNRPSASLVPKVFECFYIGQTPDAETSSSARWFPDETCFVSMCGHVFNQRMMLAGTTFSQLREVNLHLLPRTSHFLCM